MNVECRLGIENQAFERVAEVAEQAGAIDIK
jgi:hypothetical protein